MIIFQLCALGTPLLNAEVERRYQTLIGIMKSMIDFLLYLIFFWRYILKDCIILRFPKRYIGL